MDETLIFTTKGYLKVCDLEYSHQWFFDTEYIEFKETYKLDGEVVKEAIHKFIKRGHDIGTLQGAF